MLADIVQERRPVALHPVRARARALHLCDRGRGGRQFWKQTRSLFSCRDSGGRGGGRAARRAPPLPPLQRIPARAARARRHAHRTTTSTCGSRCPTANIDGAGPADIARVELYAITADRRPAITTTRKTLRKLSTLVGSEVVRKPAPPLPPPKEGQPAAAAAPPGPGVDQGAIVVLREALTPEARTPVAAAASPKSAAGCRTGRCRGRAAIRAAAGRARRAAEPAALLLRGRGERAAAATVRRSAFVPVPLGPTSCAPSEPTVTVDEKSVTIKWTAPPDARGAADRRRSGAAAVQADRCRGRRRPPTTCTRCRATRPPDSPTPVEVPTALTPAPVGATEFTQTNITLGSNAASSSARSTSSTGCTCVVPPRRSTCATLRDTFAPASPGRLDAVATPGAISLIWEASDAPDLAGYHRVARRGGQCAH